MGATCWRLSAGTAILVSMRATAYQRNLATKYRIPEQIGKRTNFNVSAKTGEEKSPYRLEPDCPRGRPRFPVPAARGRRKKDMELVGEFLLTPSCKIGRRKRSFFRGIPSSFREIKGAFFACASEKRAPISRGLRPFRKFPVFSPSETRFLQ